MITQDEIFLKEGDSWFKRNEPHLAVKRGDEIFKFFESSGLRPKRILDIGCSNGYRIAALVKKYGGQGYGLDPSMAAVKSGRKKFPKIKLRRGNSHNLSAYQNYFFDLIIISFVFHWVDRTKLFLTISEIDRVLDNNGYLIIQDFSPIYPCKVKYHHLADKEVYTYKQSYEKIFVASNLYTTILEKEFLHNSVEGINNRNLCRMAILQKRQQFNYPLYRPNA